MRAFSHTRGRGGIACMAAKPLLSGAGRGYSESAGRSCRRAHAAMAWTGMCVSRSTRNSSCRALGSPSLPKALTAALRTWGTASCRAPMKKGRKDLHPRLLNAAMASQRTSASVSCRACTNGWGSLLRPRNVLMVCSRSLALAPASKRGISGMTESLDTCAAESVSQCGGTRFAWQGRAFSSRLR